MIRLDYDMVTFISSLTSSLFPRDDMEFDMKVTM